MRLGILYRSIAALSLLIVTSAWGLADETWLGKRAFFKENAVARDGSSLGHISLGSPIQDLDDDAVLVAGVWVLKKNVMLVDEAIKHYTSGWEKNPMQTGYLLNRAAAWKFKGELDKSLTDYGEYIRAEPKSPEGYTGRGLVWELKKELDKAVADYDAAIRLQPDYGPAFNNRSQAYRLQGKLEQAIADANEAIRLEPKAVLNYRTRAAARELQNKLDEAIADYATVLRINPQDAIALGNRGILRARKGDLKAALEDFHAAIQLEPNHSGHFRNRGFLRELAGDLDEALSDYTEAIRLAPTDGIPVLARANLWRRKGELEKCLSDYAKGIKLEPENPNALNGIAWLMATSPHDKLRDGKQAVAYSTKACELTKWEDAGYLDTLGAAYAEAGDFDAAVKWQTKAVELAPNKASKEECQQHLDLYKKKMPLREGN